MAIRVFKLKRLVFNQGVTEVRYHPKMHPEVTVGFEDLAEMIEKKSTMSRGDVLGVLAELETTACYMLEKGHPVRLGILGTFYPSIETKSVDSPRRLQAS